MSMNVEPAGDLEGLYRAAVGPSQADFYVPKFLRFDAVDSSKVSWNWPALFVSFFWFLYRRMYGYWAIYCLLIPIVIAICSAIVAAVAGAGTGNSLYVLVFLGYRCAFLPMFANSLYHRSIRTQIEKLRQKVPDRATQIAVLENGPHTNQIAWVVLIVLLLPITGILAAIAIPAYQDYTIRVQIAEGLRLAEPLKSAIAEKYATGGAWPADLAELRIGSPPTGPHVVGILVDQGTVTIEYGKAANSLIAGSKLSLRPAIVGGDVVWTCGRSIASAEDAAAPAAGHNATNLAARFLPRSCRAEAH
jgi:Tfp pilus assembly major pilin PilA